MFQGTCESGKVQEKFHTFFRMGAEHSSTIHPCPIGIHCRMTARVFVNDGRGSRLGIRNKDTAEERIPVKDALLRVAIPAEMILKFPPR